MSTTGPRPADIAFDHAAAAAAVAALDRARVVLDDVAAARSAAAATARDRFRGVYAEDFTHADQDLGQTSGEAGSAVTALRSAIIAAAEAALVAQAARGQEQRAWDGAAAAPPLPAGVT